ncbi:MAG: hypothetical protein RR356_06270 [Bacteroidales bacterium]
MKPFDSVCTQPAYCYTIDHNKEYREVDIVRRYGKGVKKWKKNHMGIYDTLPQIFAKLLEQIQKMIIELLIIHGFVILTECEIKHRRRNG